MSLLDKVRVLNFKQCGDDRGQLVVVEGEKDVPFKIERLFYIYGTDTSVVRGKHSNRDSEFVLINVAGSSKVRITDGKAEKIIDLDTPMKGVYIPKLLWKDMYEFSPDSVLLVLANTKYNGKEYIRDYDEFVQVMQGMEEEA